MSDFKTKLKVAGFVIVMIACVVYIANSNNSDDENDYSEYYKEYYETSEDDAEERAKEIASKFAESLSQPYSGNISGKPPEVQTEKSTEKQTEKPTIEVNIDKRVPNYKGTSTECKNLKYSWETYDGKDTWVTKYDINTEMYKYYTTLDRYYEAYEYTNYMFDANNAKICKEIAESIYNAGINKGLSEFDAVVNVIAFVQNLKCQDDLDENGNIIDYPKYPIETLMEKGGDCEDLSILLATMLNELGYGTVIIKNTGHIMVGLMCGDNIYGTYYEKDGDQYYVIETTRKGHKLGEMLEEYRGKSAQVFITP